MSSLASCIYEGTVVHKRLTPRHHAFAYRVFTLCLDVDEIDRIDRDLRLFSRGKRKRFTVPKPTRLVYGSYGTYCVGSTIRTSQLASAAR